MTDLTNDELDELWDGVDLGRGAGDPDTNGYPGEVRWVGVDKVMVNRPPIYFGEPNEPRDFGDNDKSDPFNNIDEDQEE